MSLERDWVGGLSVTLKVGGGVCVFPACSEKEICGGIEWVLVVLYHFFFLSRSPAYHDDVHIYTYTRVIVPVGRGAVSWEIIAASGRGLYFIRARVRRIQC